MKYSDSIKPISYLKAHASELIREVCSSGETMIITHHGEARAVLQDVRTYEQTQESLALLKILAQSTESIARGNFRPVEESFDLIRKRIDEKRPV
ncbi:type II toxin-antitoxin system Phd/YefM family antitoxin [Chlorobium sp. N1]|uniref:type II toxin-antitoxin system Phd/YefM family antitoxin n=1 Tax=Chlorobium sp. N1 TaxID=2491138 RepID=UPI0010401C1A|nr:type II toxin-antitoxin system Phd/YefM family antitoxin [Chlorobium sp. N1]TCD48090.1 type II toxin-antitoxin system Phd/YefM family antitoxin [Chlorobium sp. N1]